MLTKTRIPESQTFLLVLSALIAILLIANAVGTALLLSLNWDSDSLGVLCSGGVGFIFAQVSLLSMWGVLGCESLMFRFPRSAVLGIAISLSWVAGTQLSQYPVDTEVALIFSLCGLFVFTIVSAPLWLVRLVLPMRIWHPNHHAGNDQFSIRTILVWTTICALCLAVGSRLQVNGSYRMPPRSFFRIAVPLFAGVGFFIVALATPLLWGVLAPKPKTSVWIGIGLVLCLGPPLFLMLVVLWIGQSPSGSEVAYVVLACYIFYLVMLIVLVGCLKLMRAFGFRFTTPGNANI